MCRYCSFAVSSSIGTGTDLGAVCPRGTYQRNGEGGIDSVQTGSFQLYPLGLAFSPPRAKVA
eukprot:m.90634 g.90634  ORF g.90634 m.90634 type:complete len:62 (+) comp36660_c0_seq18:420-605(+)